MGNVQTYLKFCCVLTNMNPLIVTMNQGAIDTGKESD